MRVALFVSAVALSSICFAGETSVLNHGQTAPATTPATTAPEATATTSDCDCCSRSRRRERLYNVEETCTETCRNRLFGGYVRKSTARTVYRPTRR